MVGLRCACPTLRSSRSRIPRPRGLLPVTVSRHQADQQRGRQPDPEQFAPPCSTVPRVRQFRGKVRNAERPPIPVTRLQGPEERDIRATTRERVQQPVGGDDREERSGQPPPIRPKVAEGHAGRKHAGDQGERKRVGEPAMAERRSVGGEGKDIAVREERQQCRQTPVWLGLRPGRTQSRESQPDNCMCIKRGHRSVLLYGRWWDCAVLVPPYGFLTSSQPWVLGRGRAGRGPPARS